MRGALRRRAFLVGQRSWKRWIHGWRRAPGRVGHWRFEQRRRFASANAARAAANEEPHPIDGAFVEAVGHMPRTTGIAMGLDRLVAALMGWDGIGNGRADHPTFRAG